MCKNPSTNLSVGPPPFRQGRQGLIGFLHCQTKISGQPAGKLCSGAHCQTVRHLPFLCLPSLTNPSGFCAIGGLPCAIAGNSFDVSAVAWMLYVP